ncbi:MAG: CPBP family intramembrane metalloprotease [Chloroflexi bacterium]|nr:CPBP family intramembrane metalloprotease [Chloroflexota bacterium]MBP8055544.1 CPBP family intramembrane metalloprotease [Chloroflexota bacterium]
MPLTPMQTQRKSLPWVWLALALPPILFLLSIILASIYIGFINQGDTTVIAEQVSQATPQILVVVQILMLGLLLWVRRANGLRWADLGWKVHTGQTVVRELVLGAVIGAPLAMLYVFVLSPLMVTLQQTVGDYVPPDELLSSLGASVWPFFLANVVLAPFVEENIYRGFALPQLQKRYRFLPALVLSCLFFGLLHWAGGFWYIILTGVVAGGVLAGLYVWRGNILAPFAAHLTLNIIEFLLIRLLV